MPDKTPVPASQGKKKPAVLNGKLSMKHEMTDPQGMYTGVPEDPFEEPIQDADDL